MENPELYPFDLRPQGHDIISFWLFHTVVKCYEHTDEVPFENVMINGMVLDENREAMSKSKGNVIPPSDVLAEFPVDATRYWAAGTSIGDDFPYKEGDLEAGERLLQKLWNASRLVDQLTPAPETVDAVDEEDLAAIDEWFLAELDANVASITERFQNYEFSKARNELRSFFWNTFCDDYLEIAKQRLSDGGDPSTVYALTRAHRTFLQLFAPFLPHITEELWSRQYDADGSIHTTDWPVEGGYDADLAAGETAMEVISALRRYKTDNGLPLNADLDRVRVYGHVEGLADAIAEAMHVNDLELLADAPEITTEISDIDLDYSLVGPEYGNQVGDIEAGIASGDYDIEDGRLHVAGLELDAEMFEIEEARTYSGDGEMIETDNAVVIVG
jgi:valyl-tRNA synthetase